MSWFNSCLRSKCEFHVSTWWFSFLFLAQNIRTHIKTSIRKKEKHTKTEAETEVQHVLLNQMISFVILRHLKVFADTFPNIVSKKCGKAAAVCAAIKSSNLGSELIIRCQFKLRTNEVFLANLQAFKTRFVTKRARNS